MMEFGTTVGKDMCPCALGMDTSSIGSGDIMVDADLLASRSGEAPIGDLGPGGFAIGELCW